MLMKTLKRVAAGLAVLLLGLIGLVWASAWRTEQPVGFQIGRTTDPAGAAFPIALWYPSSASPRPTTLIGNVLLSVAPEGVIRGGRLPLVVISHGNGGSVVSHADLAMALAGAGYVVAAPMHPGDNLQDASAIGRADFFARRAGQLQATLDYMLQRWPQADAIDSGRVGVFGFSAGGAAALIAAGAAPDFEQVAQRCAAKAAEEFVCQVLAQAKSPLLQGAQAGGQTVKPDPRIRALVLAAPGIGFTMGGQALAGVRVPVQLWSGTLDTTVPYASNAGIIRTAAAGPVEYHEAAGARHLSFLAPCRLLRPPAICADAEGFDRAAFHDDMNHSVIAFFDRALGLK
jgi:predicted dienelactone hydrolase